MKLLNFGKMEVLESNDDALISELKSKEKDFNSLVMRLADLGYRVKMDSWNSFSHPKVINTQGCKIDRIERVEVLG